MGIIRAAVSSVDSMYQDVWREFFICPSLNQDTLMVRVYKTAEENSGNNGNNDVITNNSIIVVNEGQSVIVVSQGKVIAKEFGRRFAFAGAAVPVTQRVYVVNIKECMGKPFHTSAPIPIHMKDKKTGLSIDGEVYISGVYSYRIVDAGKFYKFSGTVSGKARNGEYIRGQLDSEMGKALHEAVYKMTNSGVRPHELPGHADDLCELAKQEVTKKWCSDRGFEIVSLAFDSIVPMDMGMIQDVQYSSTLAGKPYDFFEINDEAVIKAGFWRCECGAYTMEKTCPFCGKNH